MLDIQTLAKETGIDDLRALPRDVSPRQYFRGRTKEGADIILMLYPDATPQSREELLNFIRIGKWLNAQGVKAPALYHLNENKAYAVFEDLGAQSFGALLREGALEQTDIYTRATDVLIHISQATPAGLPAYKDSAIHAKRTQLMEYYSTYRLRSLPSKTVMQEFRDVWTAIEGTLPPCPQGFVHGDYHLENLVFASKEQGLKQCAFIDFQDALYGPLPYDLVNILEDARADVPDNIRTVMIDRFCQHMSATEKETFLKWYRVLAMQFHGRVIGLFIKLAVEQQRDSYLVHIPRLQKYIQKSLHDPLLAPLKAFFDKEGLDFTDLKDLDGDEIRHVFQNMPS